MNCYHFSSVISSVEFDFGFGFFSVLVSHFVSRSRVQNMNLEHQLELIPEYKSLKLTIVMKIKSHPH